MFFKSASEELDAYYPVRPECAADVPKTRFKARVCTNVLLKYFSLLDVFLMSSFCLINHIWNGKIT